MYCPRCDYFLVHIEHEEIYECLECKYSIESSIVDAQNLEKIYPSLFDNIDNIEYYDILDD